MKTVFMGTPDFAVDCLKALASSRHEVVAVFSQPDKPRGRKMVMTPPDVKVAAEEYGIKVFQPSTLRDGQAYEILREIAPDVIVVVAYGKIIPADILALPRYGCVNVHASLLPHLRGAAPIQRSVLNGDRETGITIMQLDEGLDTGDILLQKAVPIGEDETSGQLFDRLKVIGADMLLEALDGIEAGTLTPVSQDDSLADYAQMLEKSEAPVDWSMPASRVHDHVRGMDPWPVAYTLINGKKVKLFGSKLSSLRGNAAGEIVELGGSFTVCCGDGGCVSFSELQAEGKSRLTAAEFNRGSRLSVGDVI